MNTRQTFATSRLLDFFSEKELVLDACEETGVPRRSPSQ